MDRSLGIARAQQRARPPAPRSLHPPTLGDLVRRYRTAAGLTQEQLAEQANISVRTLGSLELGAIMRPQRETVRLIAAALGLDNGERAEFERLARYRPPSASSATPLSNTPHNLPAPVTPLVGRVEERADIAALLGDPDVRLVTITGLGGVGKTRLGLAIATDLLPDFPDGVFFVSLAAIREPTFVVSAIAQALGVRETAERLPREALLENVRTKRSLLVLDNFEHVLTASVVVADLLSAGARLKVLVTSRAPLHVRGEHEWSLNPLPLPPARADVPAVMRAPAVELFRQRAVAVKREFRLTTKNAEAVGAICARLDGLPLAIELAAARIKVLPPAVLLGRLQPRLAVLTDGAHDLPARQRTMRDAIAWSYDLLDAAAQQLIHWLSVFAGGFTLEAAEAITGAMGGERADVFAALTVLVDNSLLHVEPRDDEARFLMLETVREYALAQLEAQGDREMAERQHAAYFLALAEEAEPHLAGDAQLTWFARLETEHENLRAALTWARDRGEIEMGLRITAALQRFWYTQGYLTEGSTWADELLMRTAAVRPNVRARALVCAGWLAFGRSALDQALTWINEGVSLWRMAGEMRGLADALTILGAVHTDMGDYAQAITLQEEALALRQQIGDPAGVALSLNNVANVLRHRGERRRALQLYEESLAIRRAEGDRTTSAVVLMNLGQLLQEMGEYGRADTVLTESLALHGGKGDKGQIATTLSNLGTNAYYEGDYDRARRYYDEALALARELDSKGDIARTLINLAHLAHTCGDRAGATTLAAESLALARATNHARNAAYALLCVADISRAAGDRETAHRHYTESLRAFHSAGNPLGIAEAVERLGLLAADGGGAVRAARLLGFSAEMRARMGTPLPPIEHSAHEHAHAALRAALGAEAFSTAWEAGTALSLDIAIAEAVRQTP